MPPDNAMTAPADEAAPPADVAPTEPVVPAPAVVAADVPAEEPAAPAEEPARPPADDPAPNEPPAPAEPPEPYEPPAPYVPPPAEPAAPDPAPDPIVPAPERAPIVPPTATLDAGLAAAAAATTEVAPPPSVPATEPEPAAESPEPPAAEPSRSRGRALLAGVAGVVLLAVVGGGVWLAGSDARAAQRTERRRADALAQSRQLALNLVSIDYRTLDRDLHRIADSTTGKARSEFDEKILENEPYKKLVTDNQAVLTSTIKRIGIEPCGADDKACKRGDAATVLVFLDQESKNKLRPTPRVDRNRVVLGLVRHGNRWLVNEVSVI